MRFVRRFRYTICMLVGLLAATGLLLLTEPQNWWVPSAFVAAMGGLTWLGRNER